MQSKGHVKVLALASMLSLSGALGAATTKVADVPTRFHVENLPKVEKNTALSAGGKTSHAESAENAEKCSVEETLCASAPLREKIAATAQAILDARALYPDSSLADLYDPLTMPPELRKAHRANDAAVLAAYGFSANATESEIVAKLFKMYEELTAKEAVR